MTEIQAAAPPVIGVVDDDDSLCRSVSRLFRASGYRCVTYHSAEAFLGDQARSLVDCLVVDVQLDGMSGIDLLQRLPSTGLHTPVVLMTAQESRRGDNVDDLVNGATTVRKSASGEELLRAVREKLQRFFGGGHHV